MVSPSSESSHNEKVEKIILSPFERAFDRQAAKLVFLVPNGLTPNQITLLGFLCGLSAALCIYLASYYSVLLLAAIVFMFLHLLADSLDGAVARERQKVSNSGYFLDQLSDVTCTIAIFTALGYSIYAHIELMIIPALIYPFNMFVLLHWIGSLKKWPFPAFGPFELQFCLMLFSFLSFIFGPNILTVFGFHLSLFDIATLIIAPFSLFESYKLSINLYRALNSSTAT